jgi:hypothetical protein
VHVHFTSRCSNTTISTAKPNVPSFPFASASTVTTRPIVKVKREKTTGAKAKKTVAAAASYPQLPQFVSSSSAASSSLAHPTLSVPTVASPSTGGYASDASHPSLHSVPSYSRATSASSSSTNVTTAVTQRMQALHNLNAIAASGAAALAEESNEPCAHDDEETKRRKLSRKAELARLARKRKKTRLGDLEAEVARLEEELARAKRGRVDLTQQSAMSMPVPVSAAEKMNHAVGSMIHAVQSGQVRQQAMISASQRVGGLTGSDAVSRSTPTPLTPLIDEYMAAYNASQSECTGHLETLQQQHLKPMRTFEFLAWLMKQSHEVSTQRGCFAQLAH